MSDWRELSEESENLLIAIQNEVLTEDERNYFGSSIVRYKHLLNFFVNKKRGLVLDLGCSPGHNTMILTKLGFRVVGINLNRIYQKKYNLK